ncbi:MAG: response regulator transcription factor [Candidatus Zixiibacteriota bacterium]
MIEENRLLRTGLAKMLNAVENFSVVPATGSGEAFLKARKTQPDVVLLDMGLKHQNTLTVVRSLKEEFPRTHVIIMDLVPEDSEVVGYVRAGVSGFVMRDATFNQLLSTIKTVAKGARVVPPAMTETLISQIAAPPFQSVTESLWPSEVRMTPRQQDVIGLIAAGKSNKEIANELNIAVYTIKSHVHTILEKLGIHSRLELASLAHSHELMRMAS